MLYRSSSLVVYVLTVIIGFGFASRTTLAQVTTIHIPPASNIPDGADIDSNTHIFLSDGGEIGYLVDAGRDDGSSTNIEVNILGGFVDFFFTANAGSTVNISGGVVEDLHAKEGSVVNISGGNVDCCVTAGFGSSVNITGGSIGDDFNANFGSIVNLSGGTMGNGFVSADGSSLNVSGDSFRLDGSLISGLDTVGNTLNLNVPAGAVLSGTLADGTPFAFLDTDGDSIANGTLTLSVADVPEAEPMTISVPADPPPLGIRNGQTLILNEGGVVDDNFNAGWGSTVQINGGQVGRDFEAVGSHITISGGMINNKFAALYGSTVNISGGTLRTFGSISDGFRFDAFNGSTVNVSGGVIGGGGEFRAWHGSEVNVSGGDIRASLEALDGSTVNLRGGSVAHLNARSGSIVDISGGLLGTGSSSTVFTALFTETGSTVNIDGGTVRGITSNGSHIIVSGGNLKEHFTARNSSVVDVSGGSISQDFWVEDDSQVTLFGAGFRLDGNLISGLDAVGATLNLDVPAGAVLSGTLADGTPFAFLDTDGDSIANGTLTLSVADVPEAEPVTISVPADLPPSGIRDGQTLILNAGGFVDDNFNAGWGSTVQINGGQVRDNFEAVGARVDIQGGYIGRDFDAFEGSVVNITGGSVGFDFDAFAGSVINVSGGSIDQLFRVFGGSTLNVSGGYIGFPIFAGDAANFRLFKGQAGSTVNLFGTEFVLDGVDITSSLSPNVPFTISDRDVNLNGVFLDGTLFDFELNSIDAGPEAFWDPNATLTITLVLPGDYNNDGTVNAADYTVWRNNLGSSVTLPGDTTPGSVASADYYVWRSNFGNLAEGLGADEAGVPETNALVLIGLGATSLSSFRRGRD